MGGDSKLNKTEPPLRGMYSPVGEINVGKCQGKAFVHIDFEMQAATHSATLARPLLPRFSPISHSASSLVNIYTSPIIITEKGPGGRGSPGFRKQDHKIYRTKARDVFREEPILRGQSEVLGREDIRRYVSE